ncbi:MAG TPA: ABC transporter substrate-binding protein [Solirubrobacteraceae bacterium]|nr:ABC transporter substrate-binding protein [Solirubrobacteraceae bacterium]
MTHRRPRVAHARQAALAGLAALAIGGCGEITNTITAPPGTADRITVVLAGAPNAFDAGLYEAQRLGLFAQSDLQVRILTRGGGADPLTLVHDRRALIGLASEPNVLLHRNLDEPLVSVAAILHSPLATIRIPVPKPGPSGGAPLGTTTRPATTTTTGRPRRGRHRVTTARTTTTRAPTTTTLTDPVSTRWPAQLQRLLNRPGHPTYDGLVVVVRQETIVEQAPLIRRFVQALARGYRAVRADPRRAIRDLISANPALAPERALESAALRAALPRIFPPGLPVWGYQDATRWNAFGSWLTLHHLLANPNAIADASTNELLAGQGV